MPSLLVAKRLARTVSAGSVISLRSLANALDRKHKIAGGVLYP
jgi:hypothetical protein